MLPRHHPDRIQIAFDDHRLVAHAGLILPATLARRLGLSQLVERRPDLGDAPGRANTGNKIMTLVASAPRFRGGRLWLEATVLMTPTCCAPAGRPAPSAAWSRRARPSRTIPPGGGPAPASGPADSVNSKLTLTRLGTSPCPAIPSPWAAPPSWGPPASKGVKRPSRRFCGPQGHDVDRRRIPSFLVGGRANSAGEP